MGPGILTELAANQNEITFTGWIEVQFKLSSESFKAITAPILVSDNPIVRFNIIEEVVKARSTGHNTEPDTIQTVSAAFSLTARTSKMLLKLIRTPEEREDVGLVRTSRMRIFLSANKVITICVTTHVGAKFKGQEILFTPSELYPLPHGLEETGGAD